MSKFVAGLIHKLNRNRIFRFTASIKLAVPLMLFMGALIAYGTIVESNYNSDYAKMKVYNSTWFLLLLGLLFLNILNSTISRFPYQRRHIGFVVTHLGLLTILVGAFMTSVWGLDGQLRVTEGTSNGTIVLPRLMLSYQLENSPRAQSVVFDKSLNEKMGSALGFINEEFGHVVKAEKLIPFARLEKTFKAEDRGNEEAQQKVALSFILRSQFFNVTEWLDTQDHPSMQLGPAQLRLVVDQGEPLKKIETHSKAAQKVSNSAPKVTKAKNKKSTGKGQVVVKNAKTGEPVATWDLSKNQFQLKDIQIQVKKKLQRATVVQNKLEESEDPNSPMNPALELEVKQGSKSLREVLYAKFPNFSLNKEGVFGYTMEFNPQNGGAVESEIAQVDSSEDSADENPHIHAKGEVAHAPAGMPSGKDHIIEFRVDPKNPQQARIVLYKKGQIVGSEKISEGQSYQTPWMGMTVFLGTLMWGGASAYEAHPIEPQKGQELPPSAIALRQPATDNSFWLAEGDVKEIEHKGRRGEVYFGRETWTLPFSVALKKFSKVDYPGTDTAMSFESDVEVAGQNHKISMNEPLKYDGYTLYQSSYILNPKGPPDSIFSVSHDPGRAVKYSGSLVLAIGIILLTLTRSRRFQHWFATKT